MKPKKIIPKNPSPVARSVEDIVGCKWSLVVLGLVEKGVNRPGYMTKSVVGLTPKVLNQRLVKMQKYGILRKKIFPEIPPRVEYSLTPFGKKFMKIIEAVQKLEIAN